MKIDNLAGRFLLSGVFLLSLLGLSLTLSACGRKAPPTPIYSAQAFSWRNVSAELTPAGCLSVHGFVDGALRNLSHIVLEVQAVDETCVGCPFVAQEQYGITAAEALDGPGLDSFHLSYCPGNQSDSYRWRILGRNIQPSLADVMTPVRVLAVDINYPEVEGE